MTIIKKIINYYLILFLIGCSSRPPVTVEEAREMETKIIYGESKEVLKASMNVLQDMYYSIEEIDAEMGLLIATKETQGQQGEIRKEKNVNEDDSLIKKIVIGFFVFTLLAGMFMLVGKNNNTENNDSNHHHHSNTVYHSNNQSEGNKFYKYKITINASELGTDETKLRVSAIGQKIIGDEVYKSGPIHDKEFYNKFFNQLNIELGY